MKVIAGQIIDQVPGKLIQELADTGWYGRLWHKDHLVRCSVHVGNPVCSLVLWRAINQGRSKPGVCWIAEGERLLGWRGLLRLFLSVRGFEGECVVVDVVLLAGFHDVLIESVCKSD